MENELFTKEGRLDIPFGSEIDIYNSDVATNTIVLKKDHVYSLDGHTKLYYYNSDNICVIGNECSDKDLDNCRNIDYTSSEKMALAIVVLNRLALLYSLYIKCKKGEDKYIICYNSKNNICLTTINSNESYKDIFLTPYRFISEHVAADFINKFNYLLTIAAPAYTFKED